MTRPAVENAIKMYEREPERFGDGQIKNLAKHAEHYHIPFRVVTEEQADFNVFRALRYLGEGFLQGFTTLKIGEQVPVNPYERVVKYVGRAAGYAGWIPSFGTGLGAKAVATLSGKSVPLLVSGRVMNAIRPIAGSALRGLTKAVGTTAMAGEAGAITAAMNFIGKATTKHVVEGAMRLGIAGAVSNWQEGIDGMMAGLAGGTYMEAGDRLIANAVGSMVGGAIGGPHGGGMTSQAVTRMLMGAMWNGLPSTMRRETTPDQVYYYLIGAFFAYRDMPAKDAVARRLYHKNAAGIVAGKPIEEFEGYAKAEPEVQKKMRELWHRDNFETEEYKWSNYYIAKLLIDRGIDPKENPEKFEETVANVRLTFAAMKEQSEKLGEEHKDSVEKQEADHELMMRMVEESLERGGLVTPKEPAYKPSDATKVTDAKPLNMAINMAVLPLVPRKNILGEYVLTRRGDVPAPTQVSSKIDEAIKLFPQLDSRNFQKYGDDAYKSAIASLESQIAGAMASADAWNIRVWEHESKISSGTEREAAWAKAYIDRDKKRVKDFISYAEKSKARLEYVRNNPGLVKNGIANAIERVNVAAKVGVFDDIADFMSIVERSYGGSKYGKEEVDRIIKTLRRVNIDNKSEDAFHDVRFAFRDFVLSSLASPGVRSYIENTRSHDKINSIITKYGLAVTQYLGDGQRINRDRDLIVSAAASAGRGGIPSISRGLASPLFDLDKNSFVYKGQVATGDSPVNDGLGEYRISRAPLLTSDFVAPSRQANVSAPTIPIKLVFGKAKAGKVRVKNHSQYGNLPRTDGNKINVMRQPGSKHYGNPFTGTDRGKDTIRMSNIDDAVNAYIRWLEDPDAIFVDRSGVEHRNVNPEQRQWILRQIDSGRLDNAELQYYKDTKRFGDYRSHADALADFVRARRTRPITDAKPQTIDQRAEEIREGEKLTPEEIRHRMETSVYRGASDDYIPQEVLDSLRRIIETNYNVKLTDDEVRMFHYDWKEFETIATMMIGGKTFFTVPNLIAANDHFLATQLKMSNSVVFDGDSQASTELLRQASLDPKLMKVVNPPFATRAFSIAFIPGDKQLSGVERPNFENLKQALKAGATVITPDEYAAPRTPQSYWGEFADYMKSYGYIDKGGIWLKPIDGVDTGTWEVLAATQRSRLESIALYGNGDVATAGQKLTKIFTTALMQIHGSEYKEQMMVGKRDAFLAAINRDPSRANITKWIDANADLNLTNDDESALYNIGWIKSNYSWGDNYITVLKFRERSAEEISRDGDEIGRYVLDAVEIEKAEGGKLIAGKPVATEVPLVRALFNQIPWLRGINALRVVNKSYRIGQGPDTLDDIYGKNADAYADIVAQGVNRKLVREFYNEQIRYFYFGGRNDHPEDNYIVQHRELYTFFGENIEAGLMSHMMRAAQNNRVPMRDFKRVMDDEYVRFMEDTLGFSKYQLSVMKPEEAQEWRNIFVEQWGNTLLWLREFNMRDDLNFMFEEGFFKNSNEFNKRMQILLTTGAPIKKSDAEEVYLQRWAPDIQFDKLKIAIADVDYAVLSENDPEIWESSEDGNIYVRRAFLDTINIVAGLPFDGGSNKSFIVHSDKEHGMMLGKYLFKVASPEQEKLLDKLGVDMIADSNAIKHMGSRGTTQISYRNGWITPGETKVYTIGIEDIRIVGSERNSADSINKENVITKQMVTNLVGNYEARSDFLNTVFNESANGKAHINDKAMELIGKDRISGEDVKWLMDNLDSIGVREIGRLIETGNATIAKAIVSKIANINAFMGGMDKVEENRGEETTEAALYSDGTYAGAIERLLNLNSPVAVADKHAAKYVGTALNSYISNRIMRPVIGNNIFKAKSRGMLLSEYRVARDEFMLGQNYEDFKVNFYGRDTTLGKLWWEYQGLVRMNSKESGQVKLRKSMEEFFNNIAVQRIPQDNPAGMQVLKFKGFIDVKTNDIIVSSYVKEMTGGADDDGDSYYAWFGGRSEDGKSGAGMKQSWLKHFKKSRDAYRGLFSDPKFTQNGKNGTIKQDYEVDENGIERRLRDVLIPEDNRDPLRNYKELMSDRWLVGAPSITKHSASSTIFARKALGESVTSTTVMTQAYYNLLDTTPGGITFWSGKHEYSITPRDPNSREVDLAMRMKAVLITSVADPTDFNQAPRLENAKTAIFDKFFIIKDADGNVINRSNQYYGAVAYAAMKPYQDVADALGPKGSKEGYFVFKQGVGQFPLAEGVNGTYYSAIARSVADVDWNFDFYTIYGNRIRYIYDGLDRLVPKHNKDVAPGRYTKSEFLNAWSDITAMDIVTDVSLGDAYKYYYDSRASTKTKHVYRNVPKSFVDFKFGASDHNKAMLDLYDYFNGRRKISDLEFDPDGRLSFAERGQLASILEKAGHKPQNGANGKPKPKNDNDPIERYKMDRETDISFFTRMRERTAALIQQDILDMKTFIVVKSLIEQNNLDEKDKSLHRHINEIWKQANIFKNLVSRGRDSKGDLIEQPKQSIEITDEQARLYRLKLREPWEKAMFDAFMLGSWQMHTPDSFAREFNVDKDGRPRMKKKYNAKGELVGEEIDWKETEGDYLNRVKKQINETNYSQLGIAFSSVGNDSKNAFYGIDQRMYDTLNVLYKKYADVADEAAGMLEPLRDASIPISDELKDIALRMAERRVRIESLKETLANLDSELKLQSREGFVDRIAENSKMMEEIMKAKGVAPTPEEEAKVRDEVRQLYNKLKNNLEYFGWPEREDVPLEGLLRGLFSKTFTQMTYKDWRYFNNWLDSIRKPTWFQSLLGDRADTVPEIRKWEYFLFPEATERRQMRSGIKGRLEQVVYIGADGKWTQGWGYKPTALIGDVQHVMGSLSDQVTGVIESFMRTMMMKLDPMWLPYKDDMEAILEREVLRRDIASDRIHVEWYTKSNDMGMAKAKERDAKRHEQLLASFEAKHPELLTKTFKVNTKAGEKIYTAEEARLYISDILTKNNEALHMMQKGQTDENGNNTYIEQWRTTATELFKPILKRFKGFNMAKFEEHFRFVDLYDLNRFSDDMMNILGSGKMLPIEIGIDGFYRMGQSMAMQHQIFEAAKIAKDDADFAVKAASILRRFARRKEVWTGQLPFDVYFPRWNENPAARRKRVGERQQRLVNRFNSLEPQKNDLDRQLKEMAPHFTDIAKLNERDHAIYRAREKMLRGINREISEIQNEMLMLRKQLKHGITGLEMNEDLMGADRIYELMLERDRATDSKRRAELDNAIQFEQAGYRVRSQSRRESGIIDYERTLESYQQMSESVIKAYYKNASWLLGKNRILVAERNNEFGEMTQPWIKFTKLFLSDSIGNPTILTEDMLNDPAMKLKGNPYVYVTDGFVSKWMYDLGVNVGAIKVDERIPKELRRVDYATLNRISQVEAWYEMASLLAHTKSMAANLFGGQSMTAISTGLGNLVKARNIKHLRERINPHWQNRADVMRDVNAAGIIEQYMIAEAGSSVRPRPENFGKFAEAAAKVIAKNPDVDDTTLLDLSKQFKIPQAVSDAAAWFMRRAERTLRMDSFLSHYLYYDDLTGNTLKGYYDADGTWHFNPILLKMAKDGVKLTQFLYTAPYRPAFARTAFGKIVTRFQLWTMNSVNTRSLITEQAKVYGFDEGTPAYDRFSRMMVMDLVTLALAQAFMFSIFDATLPAPWSWMSDLGNWAFGSDEEKKAAFFGAYPHGVAPLQVITPPIARMFPASVSAMVSGDWKRVTDYTVWTLFPFGRMARDLQKSYINPKSFIDRMTGFPFSRMEGFGKEETLETDKKEGKQ